MLEQIAYEGRFIQAQRYKVYHVGELESLSATALYYGTVGSGFGGSIPTSKGFVVPLGNLKIPELKDVHQTYLIDEEGSLSGGHTTFVSDKGTKRISDD